MDNDPDARSAVRAPQSALRDGAGLDPYLVIAETNIKVGHWILQHPQGEQINASRWPPLFRFRGDYRLVSLTYHCAPFPTAIDPTDTPR